MSQHKKRKKGRFVGIPYHVASSDQFCALSANAVKLIVDLSHQRTGSNNGNLSACWALMKNRGWKSKGTLHRAFKELKDKGFIIVTKQGMKVRGRPTLCAVTWDGIDDCNINYDDGVKANSVPLSLWSKCRKAINTG